LITLAGFKSKYFNDYEYSLISRKTEPTSNQRFEFSSPLPNQVVVPAQFLLHFIPPNSSPRSSEGLLFHAGVQQVDLAMKY
jgi:hypothetical protein